MVTYLTNKWKQWGEIVETIYQDILRLLISLERGFCCFIYCWIPCAKNDFWHVVLTVIVVMMVMKRKEEKKTITVTYIILLPARLHFIQISSLTHTAIQEGMCCYHYPHFASEETEVWRG